MGQIYSSIYYYFYPKEEIEKFLDEMEKDLKTSKKNIKNFNKTYPIFYNDIR